MQNSAGASITLPVFPLKTNLFSPFVERDMKKALVRKKKITKWFEKLAFSFTTHRRYKKVLVYFIRKGVFIFV